MQHPPWPTYPHKHPYRRRHVLVAVFKSIYARFGIFSGIKQHNMLGRSCCEGLSLPVKVKSAVDRFFSFSAGGCHLPSTISITHHTPRQMVGGEKWGALTCRRHCKIYERHEKKKIKPKWRGMRCLAGGAMLARNLNDMPYMYILVYIWDSS